MVGVHSCSASSGLNWEHLYLRQPAYMCLDRLVSRKFASLRNFCYWHVKCWLLVWQFCCGAGIFGCSVSAKKIGLSEVITIGDQKVLENNSCYIKRISTHFMIWQDDVKRPTYATKMVLFCLSGGVGGTCRIMDALFPETFSCHVSPTNMQMGLPLARTDAKTTPHPTTMLHWRNIAKHVRS